MEQEKKETQVKKAYTKPTITRVELVAGEAVLALCKVNSGARAACEPDLTCLATPRS
jgi:hypothetical protein